MVEEMELPGKYILSDNLDTKGKEDDRTAKHIDWEKRIKNEYTALSEDNIEQVLQEEIGKTFSTVLEHAGVFNEIITGKRHSEALLAKSNLFDRVSNKKLFLLNRLL
ncbi:UDPglucose--hexose-1-phosphate uridylyltransferase [Thalassobacillus cyri]|uniref:UDPglucose--hexose-1-phosphate uridylyltransferase n=1 Tax=Thalassobacillus cyri TaxID=571932 RepID=A0A1H4AAV9_9BACI|nr:hypothetical protein [Thalassobacillus cyri]SEA32831.1 UDPglucose--hexose-1-phosphate uridylyltransferase [Thalassobacillus cyri]